MYALCAYFFFIIAGHDKDIIKKGRVGSWRTLNKSQGLRNLEAEQGGAAAANYLLVTTFIFFYFYFFFSRNTTAHIHLFWGHHSWK